MSSRAVASSSMTRTQSARVERPRSELIGSSADTSVLAGKRTVKAEPLPGFTRQCHVASHHARELARDGQAKTSSTVLPCGRGIGLSEFLEQLRLLLRRHADAGIGHRELDPIALVDHFSRKQRHFALLGKLASVAQEIEQDLSQPHGIDGERAKVLLAFDDEAVVILLGKLPRGVDHLSRSAGPKPPFRD